MMIITRISPRLVSNSVEHINADLDRWLAWFAAHSSQEFGDNPAPVFQLEDELYDLCKRLDQLRKQFRPESAASDAIYAYGRARDALHQAREYVVRVRDSEYGSNDQTRHTRSLLGVARSRLDLLLNAVQRCQADDHIAALR